MSFKVTKTEPRGSAKAIKIASSVTTVDATGSVTYTDVSGTVSNVDLASTVSHVAIAAGVAYRLISPSSILLGYYLLRHEAFDFVTAIDTTNVTFGKSLFDEASFVEDVTKFFHGKGNNDTAFITTVLDLGLRKLITPDFGTVGDNISYQVDFKRTFLDEANFSEYQVFDTTKGLQESPVASELLARSFATAKTDAFTSSDATSLRPNKVLLNEADFSDDQTVDFGKGLFDVGTVLEALALDTTKPFDGSSDITDVQRFDTTKRLVEAIDSADVFTRDVNFVRAFANAYQASDLASLRPNKYFANEASFTQELDRTVQFDRRPNDIGQFADVTAFDNTKLLQDDGSVTETAVKSFNSNSSDSASFTDSGLVFWQSYVVEPTYFAEDYVGNSQTF